MSTLHLKIERSLKRAAKKQKRMDRRAQAKHRRKAAVAASVHLVAGV
jgi:hypothetical protein